MRGRNLRMGMIGCGDIARFAALFARLTPGLSLSACCDRTLETARAFADKQRIPAAYDDYRALIADPNVDALYIAVPHNLHFAMLQEAVRAGKPVLCEKPVTRTLAEGLEIARLARASGVKIGVNYQYRYDQGAFRLAHAARSGSLGRLLYARCSLPWHRDERYFTLGPWRASVAGAGGGTLITQGSHLLDLALWAMDSRPTAAIGLTAQRLIKNIEVEDLAQGVIELESGAQIAISSAMIAQPEQALRIEIFGECGTAIYSDRPWPHVTFQGAHPRPPDPPACGLHALHASLRAFRDWILDDRPYLVPVEESLPALAAVEGIYRSARSGAKETIEPFPETAFAIRRSQEDL